MSTKEFADKIKADLLMSDENIAVLVEDFDDQFFWKDVFEKAVPKLKPSFPNSSLKGAAGSSAISKYRLFVDKKLVIAKDSDHEYLFDHNLERARQNLDKPFLYQTIVYSFENFCFDIEGIKQIIYDLTLKEYNIAEFIELFNSTSEQLFFIQIYSKRNKLQLADHLAQSKLDELLSPDFDLFESLGDESSLFDEIKNRIAEDLDELKRQMLENQIFTSEELEFHLETGIEELKTEIQENFEIRGDCLHLFWQGHMMFDRIMLPYLEKIIEFLKTEKINELKIENSAATAQVRTDRIKSYKRSVAGNLKNRIAKNYRVKFEKDSVFLSKIIQKIKRELS